MRFRLVPTDDRFFDLFNDSAANVADCAQRLRALIANYRDGVATRHAEVVACEQRGDQITASILTRLGSTFVTPFDREDIHALAEELDDVVDDMLAVSELLTLVPLDAMLPELEEQAEILVKMADETVVLLRNLQPMKGFQSSLDAIDRMESEGDAVHRKLIARLFGGEFSALDVLKWKDITAAMEAALNTLEDISDVVESIALKHA